jgi:hypothetical protein
MTGGRHFNSESLPCGRDYENTDTRPDSFAINGPLPFDFALDHYSFSVRGRHSCWRGQFLKTVRTFFRGNAIGLKWPCTSGV